MSGPAKRASRHSLWTQAASRDVEGKYCSCSQCRETFSPRPALRRNNMLAEVVEMLKTSSTQQTCPPAAVVCAGLADVVCDFCSGATETKPRCLAWPIWYLTARLTWSLTTVFLCWRCTSWSLQQYQCRKRCVWSTTSWWRSTVRQTRGVSGRIKNTQWH